MKIKITITTILNTIIKSKTIKITNEEFLSFQNILQNFSNLKYIRKMEWQMECPLPENEELLILENAV